MEFCAIPSYCCQICKSIAKLASKIKTETVVKSKSFIKSKFRMNFYSKLEININIKMNHIENKNYNEKQDRFYDQNIKVVFKNA